MAEEKGTVNSKGFSLLSKISDWELKEKLQSFISRKDHQSTPKSSDSTGWVWSGRFDESCFLDRQGFIKKFDPAGKGAEDGAALIPKPEDLHSSEYEQSLLDALYADQERKANNRIALLNKFESEIDRTAIPDFSIEIRKIRQDSTGIAIPHILENSKSDLVDLKVAQGLAEREYQLFKTENGLKAEPKPGWPWQFTFAISIVMIALEGLANIAFFKDSQANGIWGAALITFLIATVNVLSALLAGYWFGKGKNYHWKYKVKKIASCIALCCYFPIMIAAHIYFGIFRDISAQKLTTSGIWADTFQAVNETGVVGSVSGFGLLLSLIGITFALTAYFKSYSKIGDIYPGYTGKKREVVDAGNRFKDVYGDMRDEIEDVFSDACMSLMHLSQRNNAVLANTDHRLREFTELSIRHVKELNREELMAQTLITLYRDENKKHRNGVPVPNFFYDPIVLDNQPMIGGEDRLEEIRGRIKVEYDQAEKALIEARQILESEKLTEFESLDEYLSNVEGTALDIIRQPAASLGFKNAATVEF